MTWIFRLFTVLGFMISLAACSSRSVTPDTEELTVQREKPTNEKCVSLGSLTGTTLTTKGKEEEALADLKKSAAAKGGNYLWVKQYSETGTSVTGEIFDCP
ncbi:MAG: DUF4156 domain-containing protein [Bdellovibrionales bacterium]|nr:DUF4156 domain-containing protein [Bdellovibrionales bacterium]